MVDQVLAALACDLGLDAILSGPSGAAAGGEGQKWAWFRRYCAASRIATSLQTHSALPLSFCDEVYKKVMELTPDDEIVDRAYESQSAFDRQHDEQLLMWLNRLARIRFRIVQDKLL